MTLLSSGESRVQKPFLLIKFTQLNASSIIGNELIKQKYTSSKYIFETSISR